MTPDELKKLAGGYATGNLSDAERQQLMEGALENQELFEALLEEDQLRELVDLPGARDRLLGALEPPPPRRRWTWLRWPAVGAAAIMATVLLTLVYIRTSSPPPQQQTVAMQKAAPPSVEPPQPETAPQAAVRDRAARPKARVVERREEKAEKRIESERQSAGPPAVVIAELPPRVDAPRDTALAAAPQPAPMRAAAPAEERVEITARQPGLAGTARQVQTLSTPSSRAAAFRAAVADSSAFHCRLEKRQASGAFDVLAQGSIVSPDDAVRVSCTGGPDGAWTILANGKPLPANARAPVDLPVKDLRGDVLITVRVDSREVQLRFRVVQQ